MSNVDYQWLSGGGETSRLVAAIGVFDGVHRGHQRLLDRVIKEARKADAQSCVITFDPPPLAIINPSPAAFQITLLREKQALLAEIGIQRLLLLTVTPEFLALSAAQFIDRVLIRELNPVGIVIGHDFRFGAAGAGSSRELREAGDQHHFWVEELPPVKLKDRRISSTLIRELIGRGRIEEVAEYLGRLPVLSGRVGTGEGIGSRELVPTANLRFDPAQLLPAPGVYRVESRIDGIRYLGVANVGDNPTFGTGDERLIEVHFIDFKGDLVDRELQIQFHGWIREKETYETVEELRNAIASDIEITLQIDAEKGRQSAC